MACTSTRFDLLALLLLAGLQGTHARAKFEVRLWAAIESYRGVYRHITLAIFSFPHACTYHVPALAPNLRFEGNLRAVQRVVEHASDSVSAVAWWLRRSRRYDTLTVGGDASPKVQGTFLKG